MRRVLDHHLLIQRGDFKSENRDGVPHVNALRRDHQSARWVLLCICTVRRHHNQHDCQKDQHDDWAKAPETTTHYGTSVRSLLTEVPYTARYPTISGYNLPRY